MKLLRPLILISLIFSFCLDSEFFNGYQLCQNPIPESVPPAPKPEIVTSKIIFKEYGGGLLGGLGGVIIGGLGSYGVAKMLGANIFPDSGIFYFDWPVTVAGAVGLTLGATAGTYWVGSHLHQRGKFLPTLAGAIAGGGSFVINSYFGIAAIAVLAPLGAVVGYNLSCPQPASSSKSQIWERIDLPAFCYRTEKTKGNKIIPVYDFRLVNLRF
jgi:hypothetical protein